MKPITFEECLAMLSSMLPPDDQATMAIMPKEELSRLHHGLGQWIRNNWDLWKGGPLFEHMKGLGFIHQDDMSQAIIVEYWNQLHNQPSTLQEQIAEYKKYWDNKSITFD
jgi:uncharacterized protein DUF6794